MCPKREKTFEQRLKEMPSSKDSFPIEDHIDPKTGVFTSEKKYVNEIPNVGTVDKADLVFTKGNKTYDVSLTDKAVFQAEERAFKNANPSLYLIANIGMAKLYYNSESGEHWLLLRFGRKIEWLKLEEHDFENLEASSLLSRYNYDASAVPDVIWIRKHFRKKLEILNKRYHVKSLGNLRNSHAFGKLKLSTNRKEKPCRNVS
jgi:hypothetical protein